MKLKTESLKEFFPTFILLIIKDLAKAIYYYEGLQVVLHNSNTFMPFSTYIYMQYAVDSSNHLGTILGMFLSSWDVFTWKNVTYYKDYLAFFA